MPARPLARYGLLLCLLPLPALAEAEASKPDAAKADAQKADAEKSEDAQAMARARRQATNPMRWIIEAGRIGRKPAAAPAGEGPAAAPVPAATAVVAPAVPAIRVSVEPIDPPQPTAPARPERSRSLASQPALQPAMQPAPQPTAEPVAATVPAPSGGAGDAAPSPSTAMPLPVGAAVTVPALPAAAPEPVARALPSLPPAAPPPPSAPEPDPEPQLVSMVEPALTDRVLAEIEGHTEITADLRLRADGTVEDVVLVSLTPRNLRRELRSALSQWRFQPLPQATVHRVQLVFTR